MTIITISRQFASGGDEIALSLCQELQYRLFDKRIITAAAREAGLREQDVLDYSEDDYQVHGFLERIFERMTILPYTGAWADDLYAQYLLEENKNSEENRFHFAQQTIRYACQLDNMIILGRGGQAILKGIPGVIHVRVEAPLEERILRRMAQLKQTPEIFHSEIELRRKAVESIKQKDDISREYLKHFYQIDWEDPLLYHLLLNTNLLTIPQAVKVIASLVHTLESETTPA
jgi:CMP/dCMP kinase